MGFHFPLNHDYGRKGRYRFLCNLPTACILETFGVPFGLFMVIYFSNSLIYSNILHVAGTPETEGSLIHESACVLARSDGVWTAAPWEKPGVQKSSDPMTWFEEASLKGPMGKLKHHKFFMLTKLVFQHDAGPYESRVFATKFLRHHYIMTCLFHQTHQCIIGTPS